MVGLHVGFLIPEFPQQTHIAWWRASEGMRSAGAAVQLISTRRPRENCPHPQLRAAAHDTLYLWPPSAADLQAAFILLRKTPQITNYLLTLQALSGLQRIKTLGFVAAAIRLVRISRDRRLDHVFMHSCANAAHVAALSRLMGGPPYSLRLGGDLEVYGGDHAHKMKRATLIVPAARSYEARLVEEVGLEPRRIMWSWVGTDVDAFSPLADTVPAPPPVRIVTVARLNYAKGYDFILPALAGLAKDGMDFRYLIAGAGPYEADLRGIIDKLDLRDRVELLGSLSTDEIAKLHRGCHVFVLPTCGLGEGTPAAICEAMSSGLPVVATRVGGVPDMVTDGEHGFVVEPGNSDALALSLHRIANDDLLRNRMAAAVREKAVSHFDYRVVARRILDKIEELSIEELS